MVGLGFELGIKIGLVPNPVFAQGRTWWAVEVDAQPHASLVVSVFRNGQAGDAGVQLNAGRTRGAAEYRLPQGQYMVRARDLHTDSDTVCNIAHYV